MTQGHSDRDLAVCRPQHKVPNAEIVERVKEVSTLLTLDEFLDRKPAQRAVGSVAWQVVIVNDL